MERFTEPMSAQEVQSTLAKHGIDSKITKDENPRTAQQNNSLHLSFRQFAEEINDAG